MLSTVLNGNNTVIVLPTRYGKPNVLLPFATLCLWKDRSVSTYSIVLVIEPPSSLVDTNQESHVHPSIYLTILLPMNLKLMEMEISATS